MILMELISSTCITASDHVYFYRSYGVQLNTSDNSTKWRFRIHAHAYDNRAVHKRSWNPFTAVARPFKEVGEIGSSFGVLTDALTNDPLPDKSINLKILDQFAYGNGFLLFKLLHSKCLEYDTPNGDCLDPNNYEIALPKTNDIGHTSVLVSLKNDIKDNGKIIYGLVGDACSIGESYLIKPKGISVITDMDDTIRDSDVLCKTCFIKNTFGNVPYKPVKGMPELFQKYNNEFEFPAFHYVSGVPWQFNSLYDQFLSDYNFPEGPSSYQDLKFTIKSFKKFMDVELFKFTTISNIIRDFPNRKFILLGDSGQADPESYAKVFKLFPNSILCLWIRRVNSKGKLVGNIATRLANKDSRFQHTFKDIPIEKYFIFNDIREINTLDVANGQCRP